MKILDLSPRSGGSTCALSQIGDYDVLSVESNMLYTDTLEANNKSTVDTANPREFKSEVSWDLVVAHMTRSLEHPIESVLRDVRPKAMILETKASNNKELTETLDHIRMVMRNLGYIVSTIGGDARKFGVALDCKWTFIMAVAPPIKVHFPFSTTAPIVLRDVWKDVPESFGEEFDPNLKFWYSFISEGGKMRDLPHDIKQDFLKRSGVKPYLTFLLNRLSYSKHVENLSYNPIHYQSSLCHPTELRPPTIREYARIMGFPDTWVFQGVLTQQYKMIAQASPPPLLQRFYEPVIRAIERLP